MQCVSINANLYPQQILHKYYDLYPSQASLHPGHVDLDVWRSKRATGRGVRLVRVRYLDGDPGKISLIVIFVEDAFGPPDADNWGPIVRLVTNTSIHHVLEEPCANCPLWLKVHSSSSFSSCSDVGRPLSASSSYQIIPCCDQWVEGLDFDGPISDEEKQVPAVVARLLEEVKKRSLLLHAKEREIEAKDDQLRQLHGKKEQDVLEMKVDEGPVLRPQYPLQLQLQDIDMGTLEQYWWVAAITAIFIMVWILR